MATAALQLGKARERPVEWEALALLPSDEVAGWRVWRRRKGAGYRLLRWATRLAYYVVWFERNALGRDVPDAPTNPNGLEDCGTVRTWEEAEDLCRIAYAAGGGEWAVTYEPVMVGRVHALRTELPRGDRRFDPFKVFDFSATEAVKEQARHVLVSVEDLRRIEAALKG